MVEPLLTGSRPPGATVTATVRCTFSPITPLLGSLFLGGQPIAVRDQPPNTVHSVWTAAGLTRDTRHYYRVRTYSPGENSPYRAMVRDKTADYRLKQEIGK